MTRHGSTVLVADEFGPVISIGGVMPEAESVPVEDAWAAVVAEYREGVRWQLRARRAEEVLADLVAQAEHNRGGLLMDYELNRARAVLAAAESKEV